MTEFKIPEPHFSLEEANLRQAVEWIAFGLKPLPKEYEAIIRKVEEIQNSTKEEIDHAKRLLVLALIENRIFAKGEMISGDRFHEYRHPCWHSLSRYNWDYNQIQWDKNEIFCPNQDNCTYANIIFKFNDLIDSFPKFSNLPNIGKLIDESRNRSKIKSKNKSKSSPVISTIPSYFSPYMKLLDLAVTEFKISSTNQPATKILVPWFLDKLKTVEGEKYASESKAKMLATFVREAKSQIGGIKKLKKNNPK